MSKQLATFLMGLILLGLLTGFTNQRPKENTLIHMDAKDLRHRNFYLIEKDFTCAPYAAESKHVRSYKDRIEFNEGQVTFWGHGCNDSLVSVPYNSKDFLFSKDLKLMKYKDKWYEHYSKPPEF